MRPGQDAERDNVRLVLQAASAIISGVCRMPVYVTSMPASRSARAMIFAPRSWPSSPGFATSTLIALLTMSESLPPGVVLVDQLDQDAPRRLGMNEADCARQPLARLTVDDRDALLIETPKRSR